MMRIKRGVTFAGVSPTALVALQVAEGVYNKYKTELVVTSARDGDHGRHSVHDYGFALDLRTKNLPDTGTKHAVAAELKDRLGAKYDVILEHLGKAQEHIHVEFDPR